MVSECLLLLWKFYSEVGATSDKILEQGYIRERLKLSLRKFYGRYGYLINNNIKSPSAKCYMTFLDMTIYSGTSIDQTFH